MAIIKATPVSHAWSDVAEVWRWANLTETDTADPKVVPHKADKSVQVTGNFGAAGAIDLQGALAPDADPGDFVTLNDPQGNPLSFVGNKIEAVLENAYFMGPKVTGGTGVAVDVLLLIKT